MESRKTTSSQQLLRYDWSKEVDVELDSIHENDYYMQKSFCVKANSYYLRFLGKLFFSSGDTILSYTVLMAIASDL